MYHISLILSFLRTKQCEHKTYKTKHNPNRERIAFHNLYKDVILCSICSILVYIPFPTWFLQSINLIPESKKNQTQLNFQAHNLSNHVIEPSSCPKQWQPNNLPSLLVLPMPQNGQGCFHKPIRGYLSTLFGAVPHWDERS